jgi:DUF4097 and DUF4098 domain-containing protein YvlB
MKLRVILFGLVVASLPSVVLADGDHSKDKGRSQQVERSVAADPAVTVSVCVMSGNINIQGWDKHEVRARSSQIAQAELKRADRMKLSGPATKLEVIMVNKGESGNETDNCQAAGDVDLMVPRGASVYVQTGEGSISITEVASIYARSQIGDIEIDKATRSVEAVSFSGDVSLKDSQGRVSLRSVGGVVDVANVGPSESGDCFEAITISGEIALDQVAHAQMTVKTGNGNVHFAGPLAHGGIYAFNTTSGDVTLSLPSDASFRLNAKVAADKEITSDFPLTMTSVTSMTTLRRTPAPEVAASPKTPDSPKKAEAIQETPAPAPEPTVLTIVQPKVKVKVNPVVVKTTYMSRRVIAVHGSGDSTINVASFSGTLHLEEN